MPSMTWNGRELHGWRRWMAAAIVIPLAVVTIVVAAFASVIVVAAGSVVRIATGKWPSWCVIEPHI